MTRQMTATQVKQGILRLLDDVADGDVIEITRYGRTIARLVPASGSGVLRGSAESVAMTNAADDDLFSTGVSWDVT